MRNPDDRFGSPSHRRQCLQRRFVREYVDALLEGQAALPRAVRRTAEETLRPLEEQIDARRRAADTGRRRDRGAEDSHAARRSGAAAATQ
jgi:hypothetical protein